MYRQTFPAPRGHTEPAPYFVQGTTQVFSYTVTGGDGEHVSMSSAKRFYLALSVSKGLKLVFRSTMIWYTRLTLGLE